MQGGSCDEFQGATKLIFSYIGSDVVTLLTYRLYMPRRVVVAKIVFLSYRSMAQYLNIIFINQTPFSVACCSIRLISVCIGLPPFSVQFYCSMVGKAALAVHWEMLVQYDRGDLA